MEAEGAVGVDGVDGGIDRLSGGGDEPWPNALSSPEAAAVGCVVVGALQAQVYEVYHALGQSFYVVFASGEPEE